jgi:hypothetical protein
LSEAARELCLRCGLCCNGALFEHVPLEDGESSRLASLGAEPRKVGSRDVLPQPCACLVETRCTIYPDRPRTCSRFECDMLRAYNRGALSLDTCVQRIEKVQQFLAGARHSAVASPAQLIELAGLRRTIHERTSASGDVVERSTGSLPARRPGSRG